MHLSHLSRLPTVVVYLSVCLRCYAQLEAVQNTNESWDGLFQVREVNGRSQRILTGFRVKGSAGLYTCLHGVIDAAIDPPRHSIAVNVRGDQNKTTAVEMVVGTVDLKEDLAHLVPVREAEWDAAIRATSSFEFQPIENVTHSLKPNDVVFIKGNPASSGFVQSKQGSIIGLSKYTLSGYTTVRGLESLAQRHSPETTYPIIPVLAAITHGESGSPVLNTAGKVVGVIDGGMSEGQNWAIPVQVNTFAPGNQAFENPRNPAVMAELIAIAGMKVEALTSLDRESDRSCEDAFNSGELRNGATDVQIKNCIVQSLRANKAGGPAALLFRERTQFYLWLKFPFGNRRIVDKACYSVEGVRPSRFKQVFGTGCPKDGLNSCVYYADAHHNAKVGLVPWLGAEWDPEATVTVHVEIRGNWYHVENVPLSLAQFEELPEDSDDPC
ncbi:serine protease [Edaphobacter sp. HDX4]|uniref:S1 family peptidase n=1 Tax=Edaphobacter sp. HDX4 TaxID=2794064 RepID=UPI002FE5631F